MIHGPHASYRLPLITVHVRMHLPGAPASPRLAHSASRQIATMLSRSSSDGETSLNAQSIVARTSKNPLLTAYENVLSSVRKQILSDEKEAYVRGV